jgi:hypothetical protein
MEAVGLNMFFKCVHMNRLSAGHRSSIRQPHPRINTITGKVYGNYLNRLKYINVNVTAGRQSVIKTGWSVSAKLNNLVTFK